MLGRPCTGSERGTALPVVERLWPPMTCVLCACCRGTAERCTRMQQGRHCGGRKTHDICIVSNLTPCHTDGCSSNGQHDGAQSSRTVAHKTGTRGHSPDLDTDEYADSDCKAPGEWRIHLIAQQLLQRFIRVCTERGEPVRVEDRSVHQ